MPRVDMRLPIPLFSCRALRPRRNSPRRGMKKSRMFLYMRDLCLFAAAAALFVGVFIGFVQAVYIDSFVFSTPAVFAGFVIIVGVAVLLEEAQ